jgi:predicted XRE-type DNA-binding protein
MTETYDSVWDALEDSPEMAVDMKLRSKLMIEIQEYIKDRQWQASKAAHQLGMTRPRLNDLLRGRIDQFTLDALIIAAVRAGLSVNIQIRHAA